MSIPALLSRFSQTEREPSVMSSRRIIPHFRVCSIFSTKNNWNCVARRRLMPRGPKGERRPADVIGNAVERMPELVALPSRPNNRAPSPYGCRGKCPLWVRLRSSGMSALSLLHPNKQTLIAAAGRSVRCQIPTSRCQTLGLFIVSTTHR